MNRIIVTAFLVASGSLAFSSEVLGDHERFIRRDYEVRRAELDESYRAKRDANRCSYHHHRDALIEERRRAARIDCHETRALRIRALNRELAAAARSYSLRNREIVDWYHREIDMLRTSKEIALRNARARPVLVEHHVAAHHGHPPECGCDACHAPIPVAPAPIVVPHRFDRGYRDPNLDHLHRAPMRPNPPRYDEYGGPDFSRTNSVNWAALLLSLLNR